MKGDKQRWILNESEEECTRKRDGISVEINSWLVRQYLENSNQNKESQPEKIESFWLRGCLWLWHQHVLWLKNAVIHQGIQGQIAQQDDIQLLLKLILAIYVGGD